jgi:hypothetical protein
MMSLEFFGSCPVKKTTPLEDLIEDFRAQEIIKRAYGPFKREAEQTAMFFPEHGVRGFSIQVKGENKVAELVFRQNMLPSLSDWQSLLTAMQYMLDIPGCEILDEENNALNRDVLEEWKSEDNYRRRHLYEVDSILMQLESEDATFTIPTFPFDLIIERKDIDFDKSAEEQFDQIQSALKRQVEHFASCFEPSIMKMKNKAGKEYLVIAWTPSIPTLVWEVDVVSVGAPHFGEFRAVEFTDLVDALGDRVKSVGSITAGRKRYEFPVLDFSKPKDQKLKTKIMALKSFL